MITDLVTFLWLVGGEPLQPNYSIYINGYIQIENNGEDVRNVAKVNINF